MHLYKSQQVVIKDDTEFITYHYPVRRLSDDRLTCTHTCTYRRMLQTECKNTQDTSAIPVFRRSTILDIFDQSSQQFIERLTTELMPRRKGLLGNSALCTRPAAQYYDMMVETRSWTPKW